MYKYNIVLLLAVVINKVVDQVDKIKINELPINNK